MPITYLFYIDLVISTPQQQGKGLTFEKVIPSEICSYKKYTTATLWKDFSAGLLHLHSINRNRPKAGGYCEKAG